MTERGHSESFLKSVFYAVLQSYAGRPEGVSRRALRAHFVDQRGYSPRTIKNWLEEIKHQVTRTGTSIIVPHDALLVKKPAHTPLAQEKDFGIKGRKRTLYIHKDKT